MSVNILCDLGLHNKYFWHPCIDCDNAIICEYCISSCLFGNSTSALWKLIHLKSCIISSFSLDFFNRCFCQICSIHVHMVKSSSVLLTLFLFKVIQSTSIIKWHPFFKYIGCGMRMFSIEQHFNNQIRFHFAQSTSTIKGLFKMQVGGGDENIYIEQHFNINQRRCLFKNPLP